MSLLFTIDDDEARAPQSNDSSGDSIHISNSSVKKKTKVKSKLFIDESVGKIIKSKKIYDLSSTDEEGIFFKKRNISIYFII